MTEGRHVFQIGKQDAEGNIYNVVENVILKQQFEKRPPPLHQLPPDIADFTGRQNDLKKTTDFLQRVAEGEGAVPTILVISGMPGVGQSALAIHAAHMSEELFDEQLYVDLLGSGETGRKPLDPSEVLWGFLSSLGVDPSSIPENATSRAGIFRSLLAEKSALIFLDNAHDEKQVRPLLPGSGRCAVLITSRPPLPALEGALPITLGPMPYEEALDLLAKAVGDDRVRGEADSARKIVELCGRLPLAIRTVGGKIRDKEHLSLSRYASYLEDEKVRLDRLNLGDLDVRASFELSYRELGGIEAQIFRLLSLLPGQDFEPGLSGAMLEIDEDSAFEALERLVELRLIEPSSDGRYRFHDLLRLFAREKAEADETVEDRKAARLRIVHWYLEHSGSMQHMLIPETGHKIAQEFADQEGKDPDEVGRSHFSLSLGWFEREDANLLEVIRWAHDAGSWEEAYKLAGNLVEFFYLRSMWSEWEETNELALEAARRGDNKQAEAETLTNMGIVYRQKGRWDEAIDIYKESLKIFRDLGDRHGEGQTLTNMGIVYRQKGRWDEAIDIYKESLKIFRELGDRRSVGLTLMNMGIVYRQKGRWDEAINIFKESLKIFRDLGDRHSEGLTLMNMSIVYRQKGRWDEAIDIYKESLKIFHDLGDIHSEGLTLTNMGNVYLQKGRWDEAIDIYNESLKIFHELDDRHSEGLTLMNMGNVYLQKGLKDKAVSCWEDALQKLHADSPEHKKLNEQLQSLIES